MGRRQRPPGGGLEVEDVERVFDLRDDGRVILRGLLRPRGRLWLRLREELAERRGPQTPRRRAGSPPPTAATFAVLTVLAASCITLLSAVLITF